jgi:hypothetical protein
MSPLRCAAKAWALTTASGVLYAVWVGGLPMTGDRIEFYLWTAGVSAGPCLVAVLTLTRWRSFALALLTAPPTGFAVAYCLALLAYGSGAEDGTVWRGIGGAVLGTASAIAAWAVVRLSSRRTASAPSKR